MPRGERQPYHGTQRKLVIAFDLGTTFSGVSYSVLDPGDVPKIICVTRFPAQTGGESKIPTVIFYDKRGVACAFGAETNQPEIVNRATDEGWTKAEWFKMHLRPRALSASHIRDTDIPPLPAGKSVLEVFGDFFRYLFRCTKEFFVETHANGALLWRSLEGQIDFVLTHPNGWEGAQQTQMRAAAVLGGLVPSAKESQTRIQFVTEGEASLHYCVESKLTSDVVTSGTGVIIVDAGGGTIDLSAYYMRQLAPKSFEEIATAECRLQGSIFVSRRARVFLEGGMAFCPFRSYVYDIHLYLGKLKGSRFGAAEDIEYMSEVFDKSTKTFFHDATKPSYIKFGGVRDNDPSVGIRSGQLLIPGSDVVKLFEPSVNAVVEAIKAQRVQAKKPITAVFLVGGFGASNWLFSRIQEYLRPLNISFCRPDQHVNKAVSDGAISFYLNHFVSVRIAKWTYGGDVMIPYNSNDPAHRKRRAITIGSGVPHVENRWDTIIPQGVQVSEETEFARGYIQVCSKRAQLERIESVVRCYRGTRTVVPDWIDEEPDKFPDLCKVVADTSRAARSLQPQKGLNGEYFQLNFKVVLRFGLTEHKAQISWMENGVEQRSPAVMIYEQDSKDDEVLNNMVAQLSCN